MEQIQNELCMFFVPQMRAKRVHVSESSPFNQMPAKLGHSQQHYLKKNRIGTHGRIMHFSGAS